MTILLIALFTSFVVVSHSMRRPRLLTPRPKGPSQVYFGYTHDGRRVRYVS